MFNLRLLSIVFLTFTATVFAQEPPADAATTNATVVSVISAATLRVQSAAGEEMVVLYGVLAPVSTSPLGSKAKKEVSTLLQGQKLVLEERDRLGGVSGVVAHLDNGECLNEFLVASGLALWDRVTAPEYVLLSNAEEFAKRHQAGIWTGIGEEEKSASIDASARLEEFKQRSNLRRQAFFDAAYERWLTLSDQEQLDMYNALVDVQQRTSAIADARISGLENSATQLETAAESKAADVSESQNQMAQLQQQRNEDLNRINENRQALTSPIQVVGNIGFFSQGVYDASVGMRYNDQIDNVQLIGSDYYGRMDARAAETEQRYDDALHAEAASAAAAEREREALQANARVVRNEQEQISNLHDRLTIESEASRGFLLQLRGAQNAKYAPVSRKTEIVRIKNTDASDTVAVNITAKVWRLDCEIPRTSDGAGLTIDLYQGDAATPFRRLTSDAPAFRRFLVLDDPGAFTLKVQNPNNVAFTVTVYEISAP